MTHIERNRKIRWASLAFIALAMPTAAYAQDSASQCAHVLKNVPARAADAPSGSEFAHRVSGLREAAREKAIEAELDAGDIPDFLKRFVPIHLSAPGPNGTTTRITI
jgi:hypothetical protein